MEINVTDIADCKKEFNAKLTYEELQPHFEKAYIEQRKKIKIDGFRQGKVPISIIKQRFAEMIEYNAIEDIAEDVLNEYLKKENIRFSGQGELADMDYKPKESLTFKIIFEYFPEVELKKYKGLELTQVSYIIDESIIDEEIQNIRLKSAAQELDREVLDDDYIVTLDFQELDEAGTEIIGKSTKDLKIYVGDKLLDKNMYEALKNIKEDDERIVDLKHENGTMHKYRIKCIAVEKLIYPEITEEYLKKITGRDDIKNEQDFRNHIRKSLEESYEEISNNNLQDSIINEIVKLNDVQIPPQYVQSLLEKEYEEYVEHHKKEHQGEEILSKDEYFKEKKPNIIFYTKWFQIRDKIKETEKLELTKEIKLKMVEKDARKFGIEADKMLGIYEKQKDFRAKAEDYMIMNFLKENSVITTREEVIKVRSESDSENKIIT